MTAATTSTVTSAPRQPRIDRAVATRLAATEYDRYVAALRALDPADWSRLTINTGWDVRAMSGHVVGMTHLSASLLEQRRQMRTAARRGGVFIDALTGLQVELMAGLTNAELIERMSKLAPKAAKSRRRMPGFMRRKAMPDAQTIDDGIVEEWTFAYLVDVILTRDTWMHRSDVAEATGRPMTLTADHDGVLVADVAAEWAERHGQPCTLTLTGPAGGTWTWGDGGESLGLDAVEFCRILSGRGAGDGLLTTRVPF